MITHYDGSFKIIDCTEELLNIFNKVTDEELPELEEQMNNLEPGACLWIEEYPCTYGGMKDGYHIIYNGHITL